MLRIALDGYRAQDLLAQGQSWWNPLTMRQISLQGTPRNMGRAFGEACRHEIHEFYRLRVANAVAQVPLPAACGGEIPARTLGRQTGIGSGDEFPGAPGRL